MSIVIKTYGQLEPQEKFSFSTKKGLKGGDTIRLKTFKPVFAKPYGLAEVLKVVGPDPVAQTTIYLARRIS